MTTLTPTRQPDGSRIVRCPSEPANLCEVLFASHLQSSQHPTAGDVRTAIDNTLHALSAAQCVASVAQEFGDHPETAISRMRWVADAVAAAYGDAGDRNTRPPRPAAALTAATP